jgi:Ca2+-transporting ATPase
VIAAGSAAGFGLTADVARERLAEDGPNELPRSRRRPVVVVILDVLREPMLMMLVAGGGIYLILGDTAEALMLVAFAGFSIMVTVVQAARSERAIDALRDVASPRALVIRDRTRQRIAGRDLVRGDIVLLVEGDRVPADGWVLEAEGLALDESLLTGEALPVSKTVAIAKIPGPAPRPGGDGLAYVFSGTLVVRGSGVCRVFSTGEFTEMGQIGRALAAVEMGSPRLYRETRRVVLLFAMAAVAVTGAAVLLYGLLRGSWLEATLAGIALGMSLLPEEFAVVLAIFLAMGALRMSRVRVLARRAAAIETLGSATVLCTDKTGTLTENRMRIAALRLPDGGQVRCDEDEPVPPAFGRIAEIAVRASASEPFDPMEIAFHAFVRAQRPGARLAGDDPGWTLRRHYPLDRSLLAVSRAWSKDATRQTHFIASKGAPEAIADLCDLPAEARAALRQSVDAMAGEGLRVLGVAEASWCGRELPASQRDFAFRFAGLVALEDPLRASVPDAVRHCRDAGIRVIMITGDYPETARAIARRAGIDASQVVTGSELSAIPDAEFDSRLADVAVFARILPEQKLRIVEALKRGGEVVGMTGDGVNDAPSLKAADIGIAMGGRGTDVAREASAIVLLDDDFGSIVTAVRVGRRIYDNLGKAMGFIVAVHIPIAGLALLPLLTGLPILLAPVHMALLEMIIDPVCSLVFEAESEERDIMRRPPRKAMTRLLGPALVGGAIIQGGVALLAVLLVVLHCGRDIADPVLRTTVFLALVGSILSLVLVNRRFSSSLAGAVRRPNPALGMIVTLVALLLCLIEFVPALGSVFGFAPPGLEGAVVAIGSGLCVFPLLEGLKQAQRGLSRYLFAHEGSLARHPGRDGPGQT